MYRVLINNLAQKQLDKLSFSSAKRIINKIIGLKEFPRPNSCKKLHNEKGYRIRIGEYRVLYEVGDSKKEIKVYKIAHRKDVYR